MLFVKEKKSLKQAWVAFFSSNEVTGQNTYTIKIKLKVSYNLKQN